jgi:hypothetical protein
VAFFSLPWREGVRGRGNTICFTLTLILSPQGRGNNIYIFDRLRMSGVRAQIGHLYFGFWVCLEFGISKLGLG